MIDNKTEHLGLSLPNEQNMLEDDCQRIITSFKQLDSHAKTTDERLDSAEASASSLDSRVTTAEGGISSLDNRASALETAQSATDATLQGHATALAGKADQTALEAAITTEAQARAAAVSGEATARSEAIANEASARQTAFANHDASLTAHDALVKRITVGSLSPVIGICCVERMSHKY